MAVKLRLKKGDQVIVTTGPNRGKRGEILEVIKGDRPGDHRVVVGDRGITAGKLEYRHRRAEAAEEFPLGDAIAFIRGKLAGGAH